MKAKKILLMVSMLTLLAIGTCSASIKADEVALGGLPYDSSLEYIEQIYGKPVSNSTTGSHPLWKGVITTLKYGDSVVLTMRDDKLIHADCYADNGWATPELIVVGSTKKLVEKTYGEPDSKTKDSWYYASDTDNTLGIKFVFGKDDEVRSIHIGYFD